MAFSGVGGNGLGGKAHALLSARGQVVAANSAFGGHNRDIGGAAVVRLLLWQALNH